MQNRYVYIPYSTECESDNPESGREITHNRSIWSKHDMERQHIALEFATERVPYVRHPYEPFASLLNSPARPQYRLRTHVRGEKRGQPTYHQHHLHRWPKQWPQQHFHLRARLFQRAHPQCYIRSPHRPYSEREHRKDVALGRAQACDAQGIEEMAGQGGGSEKSGLRFLMLPFRPVSPPSLISPPPSPDLLRHAYLISSTGSSAMVPAPYCVVRFDKTIKTHPSSRTSPFTM